MHIQVKSVDVEVKKGTGKTSGRAYEIKEQSGLMHSGDEIRRVVISLGDHQSPYAVGRYDVAPESFTVDQYGKLAIGRLSLVPALVGKAG